jgi:PAS domain S-box-containing protein
LSLKPPGAGDLVTGNVYLSASLRRVAYALRLRGPLAADPTAQSFHVLLIVVGVWIMITFLATMRFASMSFVRAFNIAWVPLFVIVALILLRHGYFRAATLVYLAGHWAWATVSNALTGGIRGSILILYGTLPVSAAWLLGYGATLWTAGICIITMLVFAVLDMLGISPLGAVRATALGIWFVGVLSALIATVPVAVVIRRLRATLAERRQIEDALRKSEEHFRRVFEEGPLGLALVGTDFRFLKVNSAFCQMVGYEEAELVQKSFVDITHPDDVRADVELAGRLFKREIQSYRVQKRYVKKTGEIIWANLTASVLLGSGGAPLQRLAMIEDITEIKRAQEEALLKHKLESVGTLAGGIAHDFNNLLGAVQAQAELASSELAAGSSCEEELKAIREVALRGSEIVRQLMIYSGTESEDLGLADLSTIVEEMLSLLKVSVTKRAVIEAGLDRDLPAVRAGAAQLRQIVLNLITNASDAIGDRDGVIRVITRRVALNGESAAASFAALASGDYAQLEVSDTGRGMSAKTRAKVFDPFFSTKSAGRGLGLSVVQGIVRGLGGAIHVMSEPDKGATFQVLLPCAAPVAHANDPEDNGVRMADPILRGTVLVVEDEAPLRQAIVRLLRKTGLEVFEAADGASAISRLRADGDKVDVLLLDLTIPGASHHDVVAEAAKARPSMGVILTSAYSRETIANELSPLPIRGFVRKPFEFGDLLNRLRNALSEGVATAESTGPREAGPASMRMGGG